MAEGNLPDWDEMSLFEQLALMPEETRDGILIDLLDRGVDPYGPQVMLRPNQLEIVNDRETWVSLFSAGRGAGKTRTGSGWVNERAEQHPGCEITLLGRTVADVRDVMVQGESGILATAPKDFEPEYVPSLRLLKWPNGSTAHTYSADSPSQLRGPQSHFTWVDELAAFPTKPDTSGATAWDNAQLSTRLGDHPQILVTTTPKRNAVMRELYRLADINDRYRLHLSSTLANRTNLSADYLQAIYDKYSGTHLEQQELHGELVGDAPGALWRSSDIKYGDFDDLDIPESSLLTVIGVDPAVEAGGDNTGIVVVSSTRDRDLSKRQAWVREDLTMTGAPDEWAQAVYSAWLNHPNSIVVVEGNQGGQLLRMVLHQLDASMPVAIVKAIKSKSARAEPVVMAYRGKGRVKHLEEFPLLEEEMTGWEPHLSRWSPGSVDALVWGLTTLLVDESPLYPHMPVIAAEPYQSDTRSLVPAYRQDRETIGLSVAPWRR